MPGGIHPPLSVVLTWPQPNYTDPTVRHGLVPVVCVFGFLAVCMLAARITVRGYIQKSMGIDDWLILAASVPIVGLIVTLVLAGNKYHYDRHVWDVPPETFVSERKTIFALELLYIYSSGLIKLSILCFFRRLSPAAFTRTYLHIIYASLVFVVVYMLVFSLVLVFSCSPVNAFWDQLSYDWVVAGNDYSCISEPGSIMAASTISVVQDLIAAILPTWLFWALKIPPRQKIALGVVFFVGFFLCAAGVVRVYYTYRIFYTSYDVTWNAYEILVWTAVEVLIGSMCASAPALKVFFRRILEVSSTSQWRTQISRSKHDQTLNTASASASAAPGEGAGAVEMLPAPAPPAGSSLKGGLAAIAARAKIKADAKKREREVEWLGLRSGEGSGAGVGRMQSPTLSFDSDRGAVDAAGAEGVGDGVSRRGPSALRPRPAGAAVPEGNAWLPDPILGASTPLSLSSLPRSGPGSGSGSPAEGEARSLVGGSESGLLPDSGAKGGEIGGEDGERGGSLEEGRREEDEGRAVEERAGV